MILSRRLRRRAWLLVPAALLMTAHGRAGVDVEREKAKLLAIHEQHGHAHLEGNPEMLLAHTADDLIEVDVGKVAKASRETLQERYGVYLAGATYHEWVTVEPPIVSISDDGSMAWMVARVRVRRSKPRADGSEPESSFTAAWMSAYEKVDGEWKNVAVSSSWGARRIRPHPRR